MVGSVSAPNSMLLEYLEGNYDIYKEMMHHLNRNGTWKKLAKKLPHSLSLPSYEIQEIEREPCPAFHLLMHLDSKLCSIDTFVDILSDCELPEILALFSPPEMVHILKEPGEDEDIEYVMYGGQLKLEIVAKGNPLPQYIWLHENKELEDQTTAVLTIDNFSDENEGDYTCQVTQEDSEQIVMINSRSVYAKILPEPINIIEQPSNLDVTVGDQITLTCPCDGSPAPHFQWIHGNTLLTGQNSDTLTIRSATELDEGDYYCYITNGFDEVQSRKAKVMVSPLEETLAPVSEKIALLIGNEYYMDEDMRDLCRSTNDVVTFAELLNELGFRVLALCDLTLTEMRNSIQMLCDMIPEDSYVVFYFVGHGFQLLKNCMLPVDAPRNYLYEHCLCEEEVLQNILEKKPRLLLNILDMCRSHPEEDDNPELFDDDVPEFPFKNNRNLLQIYSTDSNLNAHERATDENGIYMSHLKRFLLEDLPVTEILRKAHKSLWDEDRKAAEVQIPTLQHSLIHSHKLRHPSRANEVTQSLFTQYNMLDAPKRIEFKHVKTWGLFTFSRYKKYFQNVLEVRMSNLSQWTVTCRTDCEGLIQELERDGSDCVLRIFNLQKLKLKHMMQLTITISLNDGEVLKDNCLLELENRPLITSAELWYEGPPEDSLPEM